MRLQALSPYCGFYSIFVILSSIDPVLPLLLVPRRLRPGRHATISFHAKFLMAASVRLRQPPESDEIASTPVGQIR